MYKFCYLALISLSGWTIFGCGNSSPPTDAPVASSPPQVEASDELTEVTLYLANMNQELKIL